MDLDLQQADARVAKVLGGTPSPYPGRR